MLKLIKVIITWEITHKIINTYPFYITKLIFAIIIFRINLTHRIHHGNISNFIEFCLFKIYHIDRKIFDNESL